MLFLYLGLAAGALLLPAGVAIWVGARRKSTAVAPEDHRYRVLTESVPNMMWTTTPAGKIDYCNARVTEYTGVALQEIIDKGWRSILHPADVPGMVEAWRRCVQTGTPYRTEYRLRHRSGEYRWHLVLGLPFRNEAGVILKWIGSCTDVHDRKMSDANGKLIADVTRELSAVQEPGQVLQRFCQLMTEREAALTCIHVADESGEWSQIAKSAKEPQRVRGIDAFRQFLHEQVLRVCAAASPIATEKMPKDLQEMGFSSLVSVPMDVDGAVGVFTVGSMEPGRVFCSDDIALLRDLSERASVAHRNAIAYQRERRVSDILQRSLLPPGLPSMPGVALSATYEPGFSDAQVGGDWYDALRLDHERMVFSIGDVTGRGLQAAVIMSKVRQTIEALAMYETDPARLLDDADTVLKRTFPDAIVTALVGILDMRRGTFAYATAGHPAPRLIGEDTPLLTLPCSGLPLGLRGDREPATVEISLPERCALVLFTDGLTEATRDVVEGENRMHREISDLFADGLLSAATLSERMSQGAKRTDDTAILVVHVEHDARRLLPPMSLTWTFASDDMAKGQEIRRAIRVHLAGTLGMRPDDVFDVEVVLGELLGNVVKHASGTTEIVLEMSEHPMLHVIDCGYGFALEGDRGEDPFRESGRGMMLVKSLGSAVSVRRTVDGRTCVSARVPNVRSGYGMARTTPPSTRSAEPVVAEAAGEQT